MNEFFECIHNKLESKDYRDVNIVLGNESCDLDSAVSSIVYAAFLHWQYNQFKCKVCTRVLRDNSVYKDDIFIPVLNVNREDFMLKTEVAFCLNENGINTERLIFRDDYDFNQIVASSKTNVILVDHHKLAKKDEFVTPHVTEIIDHRPLDRTKWKYKEDTRSTIEVVGSCCTLVAQRIKDLAALMAKDVDFFNSYPICTDLLHSTIILDTVNFSKEVGKATPHDEDIVLFLESLLKPNNYDEDRKSKLNRLVQARSDISFLTPAQLLRKDVKVVGEVLVPSFPILVAEFLQKPGAQTAVKEELSKLKCRIALLLGMSLKGQLVRDTAIYSDNQGLRDQMSEFLLSWKNPDLKLVLQEATADAPDCLLYTQQNLSASRKQYMPALNEFLHKKIEQSNADICNESLCSQND